MQTKLLAKPVAFFIIQTEGESIYGYQNCKEFGFKIKIWVEVS